MDWAVSVRAQRADLTAPIVFITTGAVLAWTGVVDGGEAADQLTSLVEITLVWVLFSDAARLPLSQLRRDMGRYVRLLGIGLPPAVPRRIRELITVESGLNDGVATPVVMLAIAGAAAAAGLDTEEGAGRAAVQLLLGAAIGAAIGALGGWLLRRARRRDLAAEELTGIAVLALAVLGYAAALAVDANGFVAAFCGGLAFGTCAGRRASEELAFLEQMGGLGSLLVWLAFGAIAIPIMLERVSALTVLYAVLSLTLVRMLPVALASIGARLDRNTVLFVGWFGPRGLASLVFALLGLEALGGEADEAVAVIAVTVLLSVVAHGLSAAPLAARYGRAAERASENDPRQTLTRGHSEAGGSAD